MVIYRSYDGIVNFQGPYVVSSLSLSKENNYSEKQDSENKLRDSPYLSNSNLAS